MVGGEQRLEAWGEKTGGGLKPGLAWSGRGEELGCSPWPRGVAEAKPKRRRGSMLRTPAAALKGNKAKPEPKQGG